VGHAKLCMRGGRGWQGWQRLHSYFVAASPAVMVTAVMSVAKSHHRQTARVDEGLPDTDGSKINPKQTLVTSSDGSQMVTDVYRD